MAKPDKDEVKSKKKKDEPQPEAPAPPQEVPACPPDPKIPLLSGLGRLARSSKSLVALGATASVTYLAHIGKVPVGEALEFVTWILGLLLGTVAVEDAARKIGGRSGGTTPERASWIMQALAPILTAAAEGLKRSPLAGAMPGMPPVTGSAVAAPPVVAVPVPAEQVNALMDLAMKEGKPPGAFIDEYIEQAIDEKLKADDPKKPTGSAKKST